MKIGIDGRLWSETGVGRYIRNLVKNLQVIDRKNSYVLFALSKDYKSIKFQISSIRQAQDKFQIVKADIRWHTIEEQIKFPQIINRENLDLVHFPYFSVPIFYNRPFVVTIHDLILNHYPTGQASTLPLPIYKLKLLGYKFVIAKEARKAKKIITVSQATKMEIVDHLGVDSDKVIVIYEGVYPNVINSKVKTQNSKFQVKSKKYFLYVGNAYPHKNLERLLEAFSNIRGGFDKIRENSHINLVLVGKEDFFYKRLKEKVRKMKLLDKVIFLQNVNDEELASLYKNAIALVIPSLMEGFGLPALEAMANKCLVLSSNIPSLREVCSDTVLYFDPYNPKDIAEKMKEVCFNDLNHFSQKIKMGLERVKLFSWKKMAKETLVIYNSLIVSNKNE